VGAAADWVILQRLIEKYGKDDLRGAIAVYEPAPERRRGGSFKWYHRDHSPNSRLMTLWVNARAAAYKRHGSRLVQHKIQPTLREIFANGRGQSQFSDAIEPTFDTKPLLGNTVSKDTLVKRVLDHYGKANRWMERWKGVGDPRYDYWMGCLTLAKQCIDEGWRVEIRCPPAAEIDQPQEGSAAESPPLEVDAA
jgi:hypothetical protein